MVSQDKLQRLTLQRCRNMSWLSGLRELKPLLHLLLPLSIHWVAGEMTVFVLVDVTTSALCPGESTCSKVIYINGIHQTDGGTSTIQMSTAVNPLSLLPCPRPYFPLVCSLTSNAFRLVKIYHFNISVTKITTKLLNFIALLAWNQSEDFVYAYYVLRTISNIISQGSVFYISLAYVADVVNESKRAAVFSWITGLLSASHVLGDVLALFLPEKYIFVVSIALLIFCLVYMKFFLVETVILAPRNNPKLGCGAKIVDVFQQRYKSVKRAAEIVFFRLPVIFEFLRTFDDSGNWFNLFSGVVTSFTQSIGRRESYTLLCLAGINSICVLGVLTVQPDNNFESENKDYAGSNLQNSWYVSNSSEASQEAPLKTKKFFCDRSKGYAFVEYTTEEAASAALKEMNGKIINVWMIVVDAAKPNPPRYNRNRAGSSS
ncbi:hypothetical protein glysoja_016956 [Glycine soja]|nr:hypothetical protein glysoja_016956 [Glycine soja]